MNKTDQDVSSGSDDITIKELFNKVSLLGTFIKSKWLVILCAAIIGGGLGIGYSYYKKPVYIATSTFVLEEGGKSGGLGQYSSLASLAGIDVAGGGGAFQGDNILELYKSRTMIEKALLSKDTFNHKEQSLIERFISFNGLRTKWKPEIKNIQFTGNPNNFNRTQDSVITDIANNFNKSALLVTKLDKKLSIINVEFSSKDELFSKSFTNSLVKTVNEFYVKTKTTKSAQNVQILQRQADSLRTILNSAIGGFASAVDATPNANPMLQSLRVQPQRKQIDIQVNSSAYSEIMKNLEVSKISLRQEKPLIQIIDAPVLPLDVNRVGKIKGLLLGVILGSIIALGYITIKFISKQLFT